MDVATADRIGGRAASLSECQLLLTVVDPAGVRQIAFDPTMRAIRDGSGIALVGSSSAERLADDLRWVPLIEPDIRLPVQLVLREGDPSPTADRFERVAAAGWLAGGLTVGYVQGRSLRSSGVNDAVSR